MSRREITKFLESEDLIRTAGTLPLRAGQKERWENLCVKIVERRKGKSLVGKSRRKIERTFAFDGELGDTFSSVENFHCERNKGNFDRI